MLALQRGIEVMAENDIGSLVIMEHGDLVGMLTFREVIQRLAKNGGVIGNTVVRTAMDDHPVTCTMETEMDDQVNGLSSLLEPLIIVVLGGFIGAILVAMYLPIFRLGQAF
jgi:CBS domain-containing protein